MALPTPAKSIRLRCLQCAEKSSPTKHMAPGTTTVSTCEFQDCSLWPFRTGTAIRGKGSTLKAIRRHCLWCVKESPAEVRLCPAEGVCPLWPYRSGHNPSLRGKHGQPGVSRPFPISRRSNRGVTGIVAGGGEIECSSSG